MNRLWLLLLLVSSVVAFPDDGGEAAPLQRKRFPLRRVARPSAAETKEEPVEAAEEGLEPAQEQIPVEDAAREEALTEAPETPVNEASDNGQKKTRLRSGAANRRNDELLETLRRRRLERLTSTTDASLAEVAEVTPAAAFKSKSTASNGGSRRSFASKGQSGVEAAPVVSNGDSEKPQDDTASFRGRSRRPFKPRVPAAPAAPAEETSEEPVRRNKTFFRRRNQQSDDAEA